jgi:4a-hydroxytetrahydrobiopterin dehydratase
MFRFRTMATFVQKLTESERSTYLTRLLDQGWKQTPHRDAIQKTFEFQDFKQAWGFMSQIALKAEQENHHPE